MKLFGKIYLSIFVIFSSLLFCSSFFVSLKQVSNAESDLKNRTITLGTLTARELELAHRGSVWPFEGLNNLTQIPGFLFWWVVREDGVIHLADSAAVMDSRAVDYFPEMSPAPGEPDVFFNRQKNCALYRAPLQLGREKWSFWLGFSLNEISAIRKTVFFQGFLITVGTMGILGILLFFIVKHYLQPIQGLSVGVSAIRGGDLRHQVPVSSQDELAELAEGFNLMAQALQEKTQALKEREQFLTNIFASIQDGISILDRDYTIIKVNPAMERAYPQSLPLVGKKCYQAYHGRSQPCEICPTRRTLETGEAAREMVIERTPAGEIARYLDLSAFPMMDPTSGRMEGVVEYVFDITSQKRAEKDLRESEKRFKDITENAREWVWEVDAQGKYIYSSPVVEKLLGYDPQEVLNKHFYELFHPDDREKLKEQAFAAFAAKQTFHAFPNRNLHKDGREIWLLTSGLPVLNEAGEFIGYRGVDYDITARQQAEEALEQARKEWEEIFQAIGHPTIILDPDYSIQGANQATLDTLGMSGAEILHKKCYEIFHRRDDRPAPGCPLEKMSQSGRWETVEMEIDALDGVFLVSCTPIFDCQGRLKKIFHLATDITSCKRAEAELQRYRGHLESLVQERTVQLTRANEQLQREIFEHQRTAAKLQTSLEEKEVLLREIHHRVKNNLQLISSLLNLQAAYQGEKDPREVFAESENRIRSLTLIHESLYQSKDFSRIEFTGYLRELLIRLLQAYKIPGQSIKSAVEGNETYLDITQAIPCGLIVNELVSNALKHAFPEGREGEIQVTMMRMGDRNVLRVKDNGVGLPREADFQDKGMLGLQIVATLVNQLGGEMNYTANGGAEFTLTF